MAQHGKRPVNQKRKEPHAFLKPGSFGSYVGLLHVYNIQQTHTIKYKKEF